MKKNMYKQRLVIGAMLFSIFIILCQSINATTIINKEINHSQSNQIKNNMSILNEYNTKLEKIMLNLPSDGITSLHNLVMLVWEIISIFVGHNVVSLILTRLCCCWFVFPIVVLNNIMNFNISGGGLFELIQECLESYDFEEMIYMWGALSLFVIPIIYIFVFFVCLIKVITDGFHFEGGILDGMKKDLEYIYTPDFFIGNFKPDNNDKSNYTFREYIAAHDIEGYCYHTSILGLTFAPIIIFFLSLRFNQLS